ncbi:unnamed protein product, partial [Polarella glacialis]
VQKEYWTYDVCFGRKIAQHSADGTMRYSLGEHHAESDRLLPSGEVRELYIGGTENRTTELRYVCGSSEESTRTFTVAEDPEHYYTIVVSGPAFCIWKDNDATEVTTPDGNRMLISAVLEGMRGSCINTTNGWWTYEYCFPRGLTQFHQEGSKRDPDHTLGTMEGSSANQLPNQVNLSLVRLKPSISPRERRAPPSSHMTLKQRIGRGNVCDETGRPRETTVHFQCPPNWQSRPEAHIVSISESALCEYEVLVYTTHMCGHHRLIPTLPRGKETIQCVAEVS